MLIQNLSFSAPNKKVWGPAIRRIKNDESETDLSKYIIHFRIYLIDHKNFVELNF